MSNTYKRMSVLILAVCLILSMIVPAVNADASTTLTYTFGSGTSTKYQFYNERGSADSGYTLIHTNTKTSFPIGDTNPTWSYLNQSQTGRRVNVENSSYNYINIKFTTGDATNPCFVALQLHDVSAGTYNVTANLINGDDCGKGYLYLVSLADYNAALQAYRDSNAYNANFLTAKEAAMSSAAHAVIYGELESKALNDLTNNKNLVDCYTGKGSKPNLGTVTIEETGDYVLVIKSGGVSDNANRCWVRIRSLTMTPVVATVGSTTYTDAAKAITAIGSAAAGSNVTIHSDLSLSAALTTKANITVAAGAALDLAGNDLTANAVTVFNGGSVIDSAENAGLLKANLYASGNNGDYLPLQAAGGYKLYQYDLTSLTPENNTYWFRLTFTKSAAYELIASGTSGLEIGVDMSWTVGGVAGGTYAGAKANDFDYSGWANAVKENHKVAISVTVTGIELVDAGSFKLVPTITNSAINAA